MAVPFVCVLVALVILKPQELFPGLAELRVLHGCYALTLLAIGIDALRGRLRLALPPMLAPLFAFIAVAVAITAVRVPSATLVSAERFAILGGVMVAVALGAASERGLKWVGATVIACAVLAAVVAVDQERRELGCFVVDPADPTGRQVLEPDGRSCESVLDCREDAPDGTVDYRCERVGLLGTSSIGRRIRFRGALADPNELAVLLSMALPLAYGEAEIRARRGRRQEGALRFWAGDATRGALWTRLDALLIRLAALVRGCVVVCLVALLGLCVILTRSRTGVLAFLSVHGIWLLRRFGASGAAVGSVAAVPLLWLGGRSGEEAAASADERAELLYEGLLFVRRTWGLGVGAGRFSDECSIGMTAHNSFVLAGAEVGLLGLCAFALVVYAATKVPTSVWWRSGDGDPLGVRAYAVVASLGGALVGMTLLSWTYKDVLFVFLGLSGAIYGASRARRGAPDIRVSVKEGVWVCLGSIAMLGLMMIYLKFRLR